MSNTMRWRYGETNPVLMPVPVGIAIDIGDLVYLENGIARPASSMFDQGTLDANQEQFHDNFIGVAMQSTTGQSEEAVRIATSGVFEFLCASTTFELGDLIGTIEEVTGSELEDQAVVGVNSENLAIGRCAKREAIPSNTVLVDIVSTVLRGGAQAAA